MACISIPVAMGASALISGGLSAAGSISAANTEASAANSASANQMKMYQQTRNDLAPYITGGGNAFAALQNLMGMGGPAASQNMLNGLRNYPGYQFALQQGEQGVDRSNAAKGLLLSGGQEKDLVNFNQGSADQLFGTYFNQLAGMANTGENAAAGAGQQGQTAASAAGQDRMLGAGAVGQGIYNAGSAINGTFTNALQAYQYQAGANDPIPGAIPISPNQLSGQYYPMAA